VAGGVAEVHRTATGTVVAVMYLGHATRHLVELDVGGRLAVLRQSDHPGAPGAEAQALPGARVLLRWHRSHTFPLPTNATETPCA